MPSHVSRVLKLSCIWINGLHASLISEIVDEHRPHGCGNGFRPCTDLQKTEIQELPKRHVEAWVGGAREAELDWVLKSADCSSFLATLKQKFVDGTDEYFFSDADEDFVDEYEYIPPDVRFRDEQREMQRFLLAGNARPSRTLVTHMWSPVANADGDFIVYQSAFAAGDSENQGNGCGGEESGNGDANT